MATTAEDINSALKTATTILDQVDTDIPWSAQLNTEFNAIKAKLGVTGSAGNVDAGMWGEKAASDQDSIYSTLQAYISKLRSLNLTNLRFGWVTFVVIALAFGGLVLTYHHIHAATPTAGGTGSVTEARVTDSQLMEVVQLLSTIDDATTKISILQQGAAKAGDAERVQLGSELSKAFDELRSVTQKLNDILAQNGLQSRLSFESLSRWAKVRADVDLKSSTVGESFKSLQKQLTPELESLHTQYFWTDIPGRWFEIAWWAEFGTLVGLLFYIAGCLQIGVFRRKELTMYVTEVLITPLVVTVVFFLFRFSGITAFNPNESSIISIIGFAFILGFAIRRTVGLLDNVKKRFLPDPAPAEKSMT